MIERYTRPEMGALFKDRHKYDTWLKVELAVCEAWAAQGAIPGDAYDRIKAKAGFTIRSIEELEAKTHHDVIAFTTAVGERIGADSAYFHKGLTSSDVVDTAGNLVLKQAGQLLEEGLLRLRGALGQLALRYKHTPCIGRTHGVHAEPTTFGLRLLVWYDELGRHEERLADAIDMIAVGKLSGAVGNFAHIPPSFEETVLKSLGLQPAPVSNQVVQRDRHAQFITTLALLGATMEKIAINLRTLQRTEIYETLEPFAKGQKGSSAMPHKQNPILLERITGLARVLRGYAVTALENVALWDERDISHSGAERIIMPDACIAADYMMYKLAGVLEGLVVHEERMQQNLRSSRGLIFSQRVLLKLTEAGLSREAAYTLVQRNALTCWQDGTALNDALLSDPDVRSVLSAPQINELFTLQPYLAQVDALFKRVGLTEREAADAAAGKRRRHRGRRSTDESGANREPGHGAPLETAPVQNISERPSEWYESATLITTGRDHRRYNEGDETLGEADHQKRPPRRDSPQGQALAAEKARSKAARGGRGPGKPVAPAPKPAAPDAEPPADSAAPPLEGDPTSTEDQPKRRRRGSRGGRRHKKPEPPPA
jgi:adenylosuccinate lyase